MRRGRRSSRKSGYDCFGRREVISPSCLAAFLESFHRLVMLWWTLATNEELEVRSLTKREKMVKSIDMKRICSTTKRSTSTYVQTSLTSDGERGTYNLFWSYIKIWQEGLEHHRPGLLEEIHVSKVESRPESNTHPPHQWRRCLCDRFWEEMLLPTISAIGPHRPGSRWPQSDSNSHSTARRNQ